MSKLELKCIECGAKAMMYNMEHDGSGHAAAAFTCTNNHCRVAFVFSWSYVRAGRKEGGRKIESVNPKAASIAGVGICSAGLPCPECGEVAVMQKKIMTHKEMFTVYHACKSCGFHFSSVLVYSHMLTISASRVNEGIAAILRTMTPEQLMVIANESGNAALLPKN
ncbi:TPA: hypothetical protein RU617_000472 [Salmonella enterica]|nr:hypothetical protein [Salmonella enterica]HEA0292008.1 hypothetical protein [Salmonella enterica]HEA0861293.1 hypothetical protein [Salmonella enterica]